MFRKIIITLLAVVLTGCSGSDTVVKKNWDTRTRSISVVDLTKGNEDLMDAGARVLSELESSMDQTIFVLNPEKPSFRLKFKVTDYKQGSRLKRMATLGASQNARAELTVKAALYQNKAMLGAWEVNTWVNGGVVGGSPSDLFSQAAEEILEHMRGAY